jgi:hypothetical protein
VSYEELHEASEEKDTAILELQQATATARATLESEKKQVEGELFFPLFTCWLNSSGSAPNLIHVFSFRPADGSWDVGDPSPGDLDGLQLLSAGTGGPAGCDPRGMPGRGEGRSAGRELHGEPPPRLGRSRHLAYAKCTPPGDLEVPRRGGVALPGQPRSVVHGLHHS